MTLPVLSFWLVSVTITLPTLIHRNVTLSTKCFFFFVLQKLRFPHLVSFSPRKHDGTSHASPLDGKCFNSLRVRATHASPAVINTRVQNQPLLKRKVWETLPRQTWARHENLTVTCLRRQDPVKKDNNGHVFVSLLPSLFKTKQLDP